MTPLLLADIQRAVYNWIQEQLGGYEPRVEVIWRQQSEALPARPCVALKLTEGIKDTGFGDNVIPLPDGRFNIGSQETMTLSVQVFGSTRVHRPMAYQLGVDLKSSLKKLTVLDKLRSKNIAVQNKGEVMNLTELEETEYEERSEFDVVLGVSQNVVDDPSYIEHVNITPDVSGHTLPDIEGP